MGDETVWVRLAVPYADAVRARIDHLRLNVTEEPLSDRPGRRVLITFRGMHDEPLDAYDWVHIAGAGADHVLSSLPSDGKVPLLTRTVGKMGQQIGEYVLSYILSDLQLHTERRKLQAQSEWNVERLEGRFLFNTDVAILGVGGVAQGIASMLAPLARRVIGYGRSARHVDPFTEVRALKDFKGADIIVGAFPRTPATDRLIGSQVFDACRDALVINIGRGATLDDEALLRALDNGNLRHAVLDVFREEPLPKTEPFWAHPRVTVTPHVSGITLAEDTADAFLRHLPAFMDGTLQSTVFPDRGY
ncbi:MAG: NAD(P)-dependent oxidoreductase [Pseudomonadota bacterium]